MRAQAARTATCALDIEIGWQDGTPLRQEHLCPPRSFVLKDSAVQDGEAAFVVSSEWLDKPTHELVSVDETGVSVHSTSGSVRLAVGEQTLVHVGPLSFRVRVSTPERLPVSAVPVDRQRHVWTMASVALHGLMLGCMALMPPKASSLSLDAIGLDDRYARYLATPVIEEEELPWTPDDGLGGQGDKPQDAARDKGDEGKAGKPDSPKTDGRMAIPGNATQRRPGAVSAESVKTAGILGALAASATPGPVSDVWNANAEGYDAVAAMGALFGSQIGDNAGFNGLGMRGTGRHGGGLVDGAIGIGNLQTGELARGTPGSHSLSMRRRESVVPTLKMGPVEVRGSLSKEAIRRVIHRNLAQVRFCYEQALNARPDLSGRVAINFMIAPSGVVQNSAAGQSTLGSAEVDRCVADAVRRWTFPAPDGGGYVSVSYPFVFERTE
ncbi:MAG: AgmX/PglI C-terminal domain-containing protein [Myxococcales bacterium]